MNGQRYLALTYTNNSAYTIIELEMKFTQKEPLTEEQKLLFPDLQEHLAYWEREFTELYITGRNLKMSDPGEMVGDKSLTLNGTGIKVENKEQFALVEPDMMTILFLGPDGKAYELYYDFKTQIYGESLEGGLNVQQTLDNPLAHCYRNGSLGQLGLIMTMKKNLNWKHTESYGMNLKGMWRQSNP